MTANVKQCLKGAKQALAAQDWETAVEYSLQVLKVDARSYYAHVFLGKAYSMEGKWAESLNHYQRAIEENPRELVAWKGLFVLLRDANGVLSHEEYFERCSEYAEVLATLQLPQIELLDQLRDYVRHHPDAEEAYLWQLRPGMPLAEQLGRHLLEPQEALRRLLAKVNAREEREVARLVSRERLKLSKNDTDYTFKLNSVAWQVYEGSPVDQLYEQLVNVIDDDTERRELEHQWLEYRIKLLAAMPREDKPAFYGQVKTMVDDMVLVDHDSVLAWRLHLEWQDYVSVHELDLERISMFVRKFPTEPLGTLLRAWICSKFSNYDANLFYKMAYGETEERMTSHELDEAGEDLNPEFANAVETGSKEKLSETEVVQVLRDLQHLQKSILAHRIVSQYFVNIQEYEFALPYIKTGITLAAQAVRDLGAQLINAKRDLTLDYATVYTYLESPKYHSTALSLFDKLLADDPQNYRAKLKKSHILIERRQWQEAYDILKGVVDEYPDLYDAHSEFGWCQLHLGDAESALATFQLIIDNVKGTDATSCQFISSVHWRAASALIHKQEHEDPSGTEFVKVAFQHLVQSLKITDLFAPGYSLLGHIYEVYFKDLTRAFRCYVKAFELDAGDLVAAKYMVQYYSDLCNWQAAANICDRVIKNNMHLNTVNWPYRVLGIYYLELQQEAESIEWFQSALRIDSSDVEAWIGLGQAYAACGRIEASIKVYERALELAPEHKYAGLFLAMSLCQLAEFERSLELLRKLADKYPQEVIFKERLSAALVEYALELFDQGYLIKATICAAEVISTIEEIVSEQVLDISNIWITLSKALNIFVSTRSQFDKLPLEKLSSILDKCPLKNTEEVDQIDKTSFESLLGGDSDLNISVTLQFLILSSKCCIATSDYENLSRTVRASLWYNLGLAELSAYLMLKEMRYCNAATYCFKKSIKFQSNSFASWVCLGISSMNLNYRVSQHCFIKANVLAPKEPAIWFNMSLLALKCNDVEFSKLILNQLHGLAPQMPHSWFAKALTLEKEGDIHESTRMFAYAFLISNGRYKPVQLLYAKAALNKHLANNEDERDIEPNLELSTIAYGLGQYLKKAPDDLLALQCAILTYERLCKFTAASHLINDVSLILEGRFEQSQDERELVNYGIIKTQLARSQLGLAKFDNAIEDASLALGILEGNEAPEARRALLSNYIVLGLSYYFSGDFDQALEYFKILLNDYGSSSEVTLMISRAIYNFSGEDAIDIALQELSEYRSTHGSDLLVTITMAVMCLIEKKVGQLSILLKDLANLPLKGILSDKYKDVPLVIEEIARALNLRVPPKILWQRSAFFTPNNADVWNRLDYTISNRITHSGQCKVTAKHMSNTCFKLGTLSKTQLGIYLCPWNKEAIRLLHDHF
ncbi:AaceriAEL281Cp [[Ashbya] aceris (nom. inval.)]|nr:AaceriAEL281Cp [[Ashbya] aceris (nom. inval.)]